MLAGAAGGIGAIFQAPLGAALFAPEVLYRETEFEYEAILPCIVSSITSYAVYTQFYKKGALFFPGPVELSLPAELLPYAIFGVVCALTGFLYVRAFYGARDCIFRSLRSPDAQAGAGRADAGRHRVFRPAGNGRRLRLGPDGAGGEDAPGDDAPPRPLPIAATSCTIGSGGSGGVVGPSGSIGAMRGGRSASSATRSHPAGSSIPTLVPRGMGGFFAGVA